MIPGKNEKCGIKLMKKKVVVKKETKKNSKRHEIRHEGTGMQGYHVTQVIGN